MSNSTNKQITILRTFHNFGHSVYICPKCFNTIDIKTRCKTIELEAESNNDKGIGLECVKLDCNVRCIECDEYMFEADPGIAEYIPILNKNGVKTLYSCQGHRQFNQNVFTNADMGTISEFPYITFSADIDESKLNLIKDLIKDEEYVYLELDTFDDPEDGSYSFYALRAGRSDDNFYTDEEISDETFIRNEINRSCMRFQRMLARICRCLENGV